MLDIHSYGILLSYMWYTKQILFCSYPYSGLIEMLDSSYPPLSPLLLDLSSGVGSLPVVRLPVETLPELENYVVSKGILGVVEVNSQIDFYVAYLS